MTNDPSSVQAAFEQFILRMPWPDASLEPDSTFSTWGFLEVASKAFHAGADHKEAEFRALTGEIILHYSPEKLEELKAAAKRPARVELLEDYPSTKSAPSDDALDEFAIWWWGSNTDAQTVTEAIEQGLMTKFAKAVREAELRTDHAAD